MKSNPKTANEVDKVKYVYECIHCGFEDADDFMYCPKCKKNDEGVTKPKGSQANFIFRNVKQFFLVSCFVLFLLFFFWAFLCCLQFVFSKSIEATIMAGIDHYFGDGYFQTFCVGFYNIFLRPILSFVKFISVLQTVSISSFGDLFNIFANVNYSCTIRHDFIFGPLAQPSVGFLILFYEAGGISGGLLWLFIFIKTAASLLKETEYNGNETKINEFKTHEIEWGDQIKEIKFHKIKSGDIIYIDTIENCGKVLAIGRDEDKKDSPINLLLIQFQDGTRKNLRMEDNHRYFINKALW